MTLHTTAAGNGTQVRTTFPQFIVTPIIPFDAFKVHFDGELGVYILSTTCPSCWNLGETHIVPPPENATGKEFDAAVDEFVAAANYMRSERYECPTCESNKRQMQHADHKHYCDVHGLNEGTVMQHA